MLLVLWENSTIIKLIIAAVFLILALALHFVRKKSFGREKKAQRTSDRTMRKVRKAHGDRHAPRPSTPCMPVTRGDVFVMLAFCLVYGVVAFWDLGSMDAPVTEYAVAAGESLVFDFGEDQGITTMNWYLKDIESITFTLESRNTESEAWSEAEGTTMGRGFAWSTYTLSVSGRYLRLTNCSGDIAIAELVFQNEDGEVVTPVNIVDMEELFDETELFPEKIDYRSNTYFDEYLYARTAYEFIHGTPAAEKTHPPLGKILIAIGMTIFGTCPFGIRFMGTLFGVLMLPFVYLMGRDMTKNRMLGAFACFLFVFDFMHFVQTRMATLDGFITFFTLLMYFFMYRYSRLSFYDTPLWRTFLPLGACGISFGLGIACKWTGFYAGVGLLVLFFRILYLRTREYAYARKTPDGNSNDISHAAVMRSFRRSIIGTLCFFLVFFLAVPALIYTLSYLPFSDGTDAGLIARMVSNQQYILSFHTGVAGDHQFASSWYEWPLMLRPVLYYSKIIGQDLRAGISGFGNPLIWWAGIPAFAYMVYLILRRKTESSEKLILGETAGFLCLAYLSCYLPWCLISRFTFIYHYFPCVPFVVCMIACSFAQWKDRMGRKKFIALLVGYSAAVLLLFLLFYPVLTGQVVSKAYVETFLEWLDGWMLVQ
ncbi:MAG: phospholipid carrier-dependent glycosyltransferase [Lachnospiraceae bacterium]|nr:phospholipid carrier-dependent glycosyltransferase [Lachnospiraceae bacterium]